MENLIKPNGIPDPQSLEDALQMIRQAKNYFDNYFHYLNDDERQTLRKMANRRLAYATDAMSYSKLHIEILPRSFDPVEFESLLKFHNQLGEVHKTLQQFNEGIEDTLMAIGVDAMTYTKVVHDAMRGNAKSGKFDEALRKLDSYNAKTLKKETNDAAKEQIVSE